MHRTAGLVVALVAFGAAAALVVESPAMGRTATGPGTPYPKLCASPVAQTVGSPGTVDAAGVQSSPAGLKSGTPVGPESCGEAPEAGSSTRIEITLDDFSFIPNEFAIPAKTDVEIVLTNVGSATHNLNVDGANNPSDPGIRSGNLNGDESVTIMVNLPAGDWFVYCDIMGHYDLGMEGTIRAQ